MSQELTSRLQPDEQGASKENDSQNYMRHQQLQSAASSSLESSDGGTSSNHHTNNTTSSQFLYSHATSEQTLSAMATDSQQTTTATNQQPDKLVEHFKRRFEREKRQLDMQHEAQMRALMIHSQQQQQQQPIAEASSTCLSQQQGGGGGSPIAQIAQMQTTSGQPMASLQSTMDSHVNLQHTLHRLKLQEMPAMQLQLQLHLHQQLASSMNSNITTQTAAAAAAIGQQQQQQQQQSCAGKQLFAAADNQKLEQLKNKEKHEQSAVASQEVKEHLAGFILSKRQLSQQSSIHGSTAPASMQVDNTNNCSSLYQQLHQQQPPPSASDLEATRQSLKAAAQTIDNNLEMSIESSCTSSSDRPQSICHKSDNSTNTTTTTTTTSSATKHTIPSRYQVVKSNDDYPLRKTASEPSLPLKAQSSLKKKQIERRSTVSPLLKRKIAAAVARRRIQLTQHSQSMDYTTTTTTTTTNPATEPASATSTTSRQASYSPSPPLSRYQHHQQQHQHHKYRSHSHRDDEVPMDYDSLCSDQNPYVIWRRLQQLGMSMNTTTSTSGQSTKKQQKKQSSMASMHHHSLHQDAADSSMDKTAYHISSGAATNNSTSGQRLSQTVNFSHLISKANQQQQQHHHQQHHHSIKSISQPLLSRAQSNPHLQQSLVYQQQAAARVAANSSQLSPSHQNKSQQKSGNYTGGRTTCSTVSDPIDGAPPTAALSMMQHSAKKSAASTNKEQQSTSLDSDSIGANTPLDNQALLAKLLKQQEQHQHVKQQVRQTVLQRSSSKTKVFHNIGGGGSLDRELKTYESRQWSLDGTATQSGGSKLVAAHQLEQSAARRDNLTSVSIKNLHTSTTSNSRIANRDNSSTSSNRYIFTSQQRDLPTQIMANTSNASASLQQQAHHNSLVQQQQQQQQQNSAHQQQQHHAPVARPLPLSLAHRNQHSSSSSSTSSLLSQQDSLDDSSSLSQVIDLTLSSDSKNKTSLATRHSTITTTNSTLLTSSDINNDKTHNASIDIEESDLTARSVKDAFRQLELRQSIQQSATNQSMLFGSGVGGVGGQTSAGMNLTSSSANANGSRADLDSFRSRIQASAHDKGAMNLLASTNTTSTTGANFDPNLAAAHLNALRLSTSSLTSITPSTTPTPTSNANIGAPSAYQQQQQQFSINKQQNDSILTSAYPNFNFLQYNADMHQLSSQQCNIDNYLRHIRQTNAKTIEQHQQHQPALSSQSMDYTALDQLTFLNSLDTTSLGSTPASVCSVLQLQSRLANQYVGGGVGAGMATGGHQESSTSSLQMDMFNKPAPILQRTLSTPLFGIITADHKEAMSVDAKQNSINQQTFGSGIDLNRDSDVLAFNAQQPPTVDRDMLLFNPESKTAIAYDPSMNRHQCICANNSNHPENSLRVISIWERFLETGLAARCAKARSRCATLDELQLCHSETYTCYFGLSPLQRNKLGGLNLQDLPLEGLTLLSCGGLGVDIDTTWNETFTPTAARMATGCVIEAAIGVAKGQYKNAFAVVRPPGHHAEQSQAMGFCYFNSVAVAARVLNAKYNMERIMIVDWDVHHGNGIQKIFYEDPNILYISLHRHDEGNFFPGTGDVQEVGAGKGIGKTINIAWSSDINEVGMFGDAEYLAAFRSIVMPIGREFNPSIVLVASGFDAADGHPPNFGGYKLTPACFAYMTKQLMSLAGGKVVLILEGGYEIKGLCDCAQACLSTLLGEKIDSIRDEELKRKAILPARETLHKVAGVAVYFWPSIRKNINAIEYSALDAILKEQEETIDISS